MRLAQEISARSTSSKTPNSLTLERVEFDFLIVAFDARHLIDKGVGSVDLSLLSIRTPKRTGADDRVAAALRDIGRNKQN